jgi:FixJ family two-component response regulator
MSNEPPRIVVVEDDASMAQALERILLAGGFAATTFASAEAALEADAAALADCLILDIHLPGLSGFELYRHLALSGKAKPAIFITGRDEPAAREEAERLGSAGSYLYKPFSGRDLLDAVARAVCCHQPPEEQATS